MARVSDTIEQRRRLGYFPILLVLFGLLLLGRLFYVQVIKHGEFLAQASSEHTRKYEIPARRGELYVHDGDTTTSPIALNQRLKLVYADPRYVDNKADAAKKLASATGGDAGEYERRLEKGIEYTVLADRVPSDVAKKITALGIAGVGMKDVDYRTYPEGSLAAQVVGFVNADGIGQYGVEGYLNDVLGGTPGKLSGKTDTHGIPIYTSDNTKTLPVNGASYVLTIDRNIQAMAEQELADQVQKVKAKSGSIVIMEPNGAVRAMANYPTYDPNQYSKVGDYSVFVNQAVSSQFEPGSGMKAFTVAAGLDQGKIKPDTKFDDPGCLQVDDRKICNAEGDKAGNGKTMTVALRDSLNTGMMFILRMLGGDPSKITLSGKKTLYEYFTKHFGFGTRTGIEQANEAAGSVGAPSKDNVTYANMTFGQGISVTMVQMVAAMGAVANGGRLYQPHLIDQVLKPDGTTETVQPKVLSDHVLSAAAAADLNQMLQVVVQHGSGYIAGKMNPNYKIAGKTGTAQIPRPDGKGYIDGANIGSFVGFAPAENPRFVVMVRINEPGIKGFAETTTVPVFGEVCQWLFKYYSIPPSS